MIEHCLVEQLGVYLRTKIGGAYIGKAGSSHRLNRRLERPRLIQERFIEHPEFEPLFDCLRPRVRKYVFYVNSAAGSKYPISLSKQRGLIMRITGTLEE